MNSSDKTVHVCGRDSQLSKVQLDEVIEEMTPFFPKIIWKKTTLKSGGDLDLKTSLYGMAKNDFFTREIDAQVEEGRADVAIHSAKDLPENLSDDLCIAAITKGVSTHDALVMREGISLHNGIRIGTSSQKRIDAVKKICPGAHFIDIRGTVPGRLKLIDEGKIDALVVAEAALIRLGLTHLNRVPLTDTPTPLQGKLAVVCQKKRNDLIEMFAKIDTRRQKNVLYLGTNPENVEIDGQVIHYPIIATKPLNPSNFDALDHTTHILFTSKNGARYFADHIGNRDLSDKTIFAIGKMTAKKLLEYGIHVDKVCSEETQEGMVELLKKEPLENAHLFLPRSARSRAVLKHYFDKSGIDHTLCDLYTTIPNYNYPKPDFTCIDEIFFTSPSCVDAFVEIFGTIPEGIKLVPIGPITRMRLEILKKTTDPRMLEKIKF